MVDIEKELAEARRRLLDLSMRNRLINFRSTKARTIKVIDEIPTEIYDILVVQERVMEFLPKDKTESGSAALENGQSPSFEEIPDDSGFTQDETSVLWKLPRPDATVADRHVDRFLQTALESEALQRRLFLIHQDSQSIVEELGYSTLFLAMSFLKWTDSETSDQFRQAPLILLPVELERSKVSSSFKLRWNGDDVSTNISSQAFLSDLGISLPSFEMPETKSGIDEYLHRVKKSVSSKRTWHIVNDIYLGFFSFTKFIMYKDLDPAAWPENQSPASHPLIREILSPSGNTDSENGFDENEIDQKLTFRDLYQVTDADPSQMAAIEDIKAGHNLVVEGPPGTGKSQTITNVIAELLAAKKTVLFVSEKMAALEVVKSRLDEVGLGQFCLELHSRKSIRKEFLKELERSVSGSAPKPVSLETEFEQLEDIRLQLNDYAAALRDPFGKRLVSPFDLIGHQEQAHRHFAAVGRTMPRIHFHNPWDWDSSKYIESIRKLTQFGRALSAVSPLAVHPWQGCSPGLVLPSDEEEIAALLDKCTEILDSLKLAIECLVNVCGIRYPANLSDIQKTLEGARLVAESEPTSRDVLLNTKWNKPNKEAEGLIHQIQDLQAQRTDLLSRFQTVALNEDIGILLQEHDALLARDSLARLWMASRRASGFLPSTEETAGPSLVQCKRALRNLEDSIDGLVRICGVRYPSTLDDLSELVQASEVIVASEPTDRNVLLSAKWNRSNKQAEALIRQIEDFKGRLFNVLSTFHPKAEDEDIASMLQEYEVRSARFVVIRWLDRKYSRLTRRVAGLYKGQVPKERAKVLSDLHEMAECVELRKGLRETREIGQSLFGSLWQCEESDPESLRAFAGWIVTFRRYLQEGLLAENAVDLIVSGIPRGQAEKVIKDATQAAQNFALQRDHLMEQLGIDREAVFGVGMGEVPLSNIASLLNVWEAELPGLESWACKVSALYVGKAPREFEKVISDLNEIDDYLKSRGKLNAAEQAGQSLFGSLWRSEESNPESLRAFAGWIVTFRRYLQEGLLTENAVDLIVSGIHRGEAEKAIKKVTDIAQEFVARRDILAEKVGFDCSKALGCGANDVTLLEWDRCLRLWRSEIKKLQRWSQFVALRRDCLNTVTAPIIKCVDSDSLQPEDIVPCFEGNVASDLIAKVFSERPVLAKFTGEPHEEKIKSFAELDRKLLVKNRQRLVHTLYQSKPRIIGGASPGSETGILLGELHKKKRHMPIRKLMSVAGGLIQRIKPCFMMSPLSIAQFLDPKTARFDTIIFDEASQVRPEDGLGALLRGNQVVVMGDTRQLPPTTFFEHMVEGETDDEETAPASIADVESILHQCSRSFPTRYLRWHYRSRHESLIAVSNREFYDNRLLIYPSAIDKASHLGLHFVHLPDAVYDRGRSSVNRKEARAVVNAAMEHYRNFPEKSLGIGAFNIKQQQAILEEVELQIRLHPEMERFFSSHQREHFFVKNLETIQGDERDVILISVGFGFDESRHLHRNFGPLNQEGGHRRLNVLITRAREKCVVFANFRASDLQTDTGTPFGVRALKTFLEYAERRVLIASQPSEDTDSPFEDAVHEFLVGNGFQVRKQVGCAGFRVDLAVVHPEYPGTYAIGIECDGAKYHMSPVARDRDRLRQQILENLGWRIHRVWSTDWYRNRKDTAERLLSIVRTAVSERPPCLNPPVVSTPASSDSDNSNNEEMENDCPETVVVASNSIEEAVKDYQLCSELGIQTSGEIHETGKDDLACAVQHVVDFEGPIHMSEVVRRIRSAWGLKRSGQRIYNAIESATEWAGQKRMVVVRGKFLWPLTDRPVAVRRRSGDPPPNIDLICDEEIGEAMKLILDRQFATLPENLAIQSSRLLGIQATRDTAVQRIIGIIDDLVNKGELERMPSGMVRLVGSS